VVVEDRAFVAEGELLELSEPVSVLGEYSVDLRVQVFRRHLVGGRPHRQRTVTTLELTLRRIEGHHQVAPAEKISRPYVDRLGRCSRQP
jgi:hypothetical protein